MLKPPKNAIIIITTVHICSTERVWSTGSLNHHCSDSAIPQLVERARVLNCLWCQQRPMMTSPEELLRVQCSSATKASYLVSLQFFQDTETRRHCPVNLLLPRSREIARPPGLARICPFNLLLPKLSDAAWYYTFKIISCQIQEYWHSLQTQNLLGACTVSVSEFTPRFSTFIFVRLRYWRGMTVHLRQVETLAGNGSLKSIRTKMKKCRTLTVFQLPWYLSVKYIGVQL